MAYIYDIEVDKHGMFEFYEKLSCKKCGYIPKVDATLTENGVSVSTSEKWFLVDDNCYCPTCMRVMKINKIFKR